MPPLTNWAVAINGVKKAGWLATWHPQYALRPRIALMPIRRAITVNETPTNCWLALERKVKTHTETNTATTIEIVGIDPGRPNQLSDLGSASTMEGLRATAAR